MNATLTALNTSLTRRLPDFRTGRQMIWVAYSADGVWLYQREEDRGTSWTVIHRPTGRDLPLFPSLKSARWATATTALADLDARDLRLAQALKPATAGANGCAYFSPWAHGHTCLHAPEPGTDRCSQHALLPA